MSGVASVAFSRDSNDMSVVGAADIMNIDVDATGRNHNTSYPSNSDARAVQISFMSDIIPQYMSLFDGACNIPSWVVSVA